MAVDGAGVRAVWRSSHGHCEWRCVGSSFAHKNFGFWDSCPCFWITSWNKVDHSVSLNHHCIGCGVHWCKGLHWWWIGWMLHCCMQQRGNFQCLLVIGKQKNIVWRPLRIKKLFEMNEKHWFEIAQINCANCREMCGMWRKHTRKGKIDDGCFAQLIAQSCPKNQRNPHPMSLWTENQNKQKTFFCACIMCNATEKHKRCKDKKHPDPLVQNSDTGGHNKMTKWQVKIDADDATVEGTSG